MLGFPKVGSTTPVLEDSSFRKLGKTNAPAPLLLTAFDTDEDIYCAMQSGAKSYLLKDTPDDELSSTIRAVCAGKQVLPPKVASSLAQRQQRAKMSEREMEVLRLLIKGRSNKEIGTTLFVSEDTVKAHLKTLFTKLDVHDRTEAVIYAIRHGIVHLESH